jgi:hypothetical protein
VPPSHFVHQYANKVETFVNRVKLRTINYCASMCQTALNRDPFKFSPFSPLEDFSTGVSAFSIADGKPNVAFGVSSIQLSVCIFDIQPMHPRNFLHIGEGFRSTGLLSLSFGDGKYLLGHSGKPGWVFVVWDWESSHTIASIGPGRTKLR